MKIDWDRGTIDFKAPSATSRTEFSYGRMLLGAVLIPVGIVTGYIVIFPIIHELGHALFAAVIGQGTVVYWDKVIYVSNAGFGWQSKWISMGGPYGGLIIWTALGWMMARRLPALSIYPIAYTIGETFYCATFDYYPTQDLYNMPIAQSFLFFGLLICVFIYVMRLTGGLSYWKAKLIKKT